MRRLFRLVLLCLVALALPLQGATAAAAMAGAQVPAERMAAMAAMTAADHGMAMADAAPCPHHPAMHAAGHAPLHAGCGACCGPAVSEQPLLAVAPVAARWAPVRAAAVPARRAQFLTDGPERPPRAA